MSRNGERWSLREFLGGLTPLYAREPERVGHLYVDQVRESASQDKFVGQAMRELPHAR